MNKRFLILGGIISVFVFLFMGLLVNIQILQRSIYSEKVDKLVSKENALLPLRGRIFDKNRDIPLVYNKSTYSIYLRVDEFPTKNRKNLIVEIADFFKINPEKIENVFKKENYTKQYVLLAGLSYEELTEYLEFLPHYSALKWRQDTQRYYEFNESMSHIVGYVGDISASELRDLQYKRYSNFEVIGKAGVEKQYEDDLRGIKGIAKEQINVLGRSVKNTREIVENPRPGYDIVLSVDRNIQTIVEKAMGERVGAAVVLKPATGEILAMYSYPQFNPNLLVGSANKKLLADIQNDLQSPFLNRAIQSAVAPASAFKLLMATAFLQEFPNDWNLIVRCTGYIVVGNRRFYCWVRTGHGYQNILNALANSCNIFFYTIGTKRLGAQNIYKYGSMFGFGSATGIDLPFEIRGTMPSPEWKERRFNDIWRDGDTTNLSIGQGFLEATPMQMAQMVSAIINNGVVYKPHVVKELRNQITGEVVRTIKPEIEKTVNVDEKVFKEVRKGMRRVVTKGTARVVVTTKATQIAAKTGTGQVGSDKKWESWFASYAPYDAPLKDKIVVVVWVSAVNEWEWWAPKAANIIYDAIFSNKTYEQTIEKFKDKYLWYL